MLDIDEWALSQHLGKYLNRYNTTKTNYYSVQIQPGKTSQTGDDLIS